MHAMWTYIMCMRFQPVNSFTTFPGVWKNQNLFFNIHLGDQYRPLCPKVAYIAMDSNVQIVSVAHVPKSYKISSVPLGNSDGH